MTPLLPNPDHYIANLITMTSSEATRLSGGGQSKNL